MDRLPGKIADMFSSDDPDDPISEAVNNARDGAAKNFDTWISASFGRSARQQISVEALPSIFLRLMLLFSADMVDIKDLLRRGGTIPYLVWLKTVEVEDRTVGQRGSPGFWGGKVVEVKQLLWYGNVE